MKISAILSFGLMMLSACSCSSKEIYNKQATKSTHSTPQSEAWGVLRVDTEWRFLPRFKNRGLAPSNVSTPGISITLTPSAFAYGLDKVSTGFVGFSALIKNEGTEAITIAHPSRCLPHNNFKQGQIRHLSDNYGKSEILLKITKPDGTNVILRDGWAHGFDPNNIYHFKIPPGGTQSFYLGWFFQNARGKWENDAEAAIVFLDKGTYKARIIFRNTFPWAYLYSNDTNKVDPLGGAKSCLSRWGKEEPLRVNPEQAPAFRPESRRVDFERVWTGEMQSEEVVIEIK